MADFRPALAARRRGGASWGRTTQTRCARRTTSQGHSPSWTSTPRRWRSTGPRWRGRRRALGPEHKKTLNTAGESADALDTLGQHDEAEPLYRETLDALRRVLGVDHADTLLTAFNLADCLSNNQGKHAEAVELLQGVLAVEQLTKGPGHADTLQTAARLAAVQAVARATPGAQ